jgi:hypothetical protein
VTIALITFAAGDPIWNLASLRLSLQARKSGVFAKTKRYSKNSLRRILTQEDLNFIQRTPRGHGLWIWKAAITLDFLSKNPDVDVILYLDAGCDFVYTDKSLVAWRNYIRLLEKKDAIVFQMTQTEIEWTKAEVVQRMKPKENILESGQLIAGAYFMRREFAFEFCNNWLELMRHENYSLLSEEFNATIQNHRFRMPRHDQSIFSILMKNSPNVIIRDTEKENMFDPNWGRNQVWPIWTSRNKSIMPMYQTNLLAKCIRFLERIISKIYRELVRNKRHFFDRDRT